MKFKYFFFIFLLVALTGCWRPYAINRSDMYIVPSIDEMPQKVTFITEVQDPVRNLSEGGEGRNSWQSFLVDPENKQSNYLAVDFGIRDRECNRVLLTLVPKSISELKGSYYFSVNHAGTTIYNHLGQSKELKSLSKEPKPADYKGFMSAINGGNIFISEVDRDSEEFAAIRKLYTNYRLQDLTLARKYIYSKYGSELTEKELEDIRKEDSIVRSFADWLGRDWKLFLMYPFTSISGTAVISGVVKVFTLPSIWGDKINKPGYMEYITDAKETAKIALRAVREKELYNQCVQSHQ